jgi:hypothetical protein
MEEELKVNIHRKVLEITHKEFLCININLVKRYGQPFHHLS